MRNLHQLYERGQSPWYDNLSRSLIESGELAALVDQGIVGVTSNPTIFDQAISSSSDYDSSLLSCHERGLDATQTYWELVCDDIIAAADILKPVYDRTNGRDGYVSVEVSPLLARNTAETIAQANELFARISRNNVMIKIPATVEGIEAIEAVLSNAIPVNVTLIFSQERYADVIGAYQRAMDSLQAQGVEELPQSVASFFVSRLESKADALLSSHSPLRGRVAVANAAMAYKMFESAFPADKRTSSQRPLWASTGTKNPDYSPVLYVDELIATNTVNTLPHATIDAIGSTDGEYPQASLDDVFSRNEMVWNDAITAIDMPTVFKELEEEGVASFERSFHSCLASISARLAEI